MLIAATRPDDVVVCLLGTREFILTVYLRPTAARNLLLPPSPPSLPLRQRRVGTEGDSFSAFGAESDLARSRSRATYRCAQWINWRLTAAAFVAQIGKSPDVAEADGVADAGQHELHLVRPMRPPGLPVIARVVRLPVVEAGARREIILEPATSSTSAFGAVVVRVRP